VFYWLANPSLASAVMLLKCVILLDAIHMSGECHMFSHCSSEGLIVASASPMLTLVVQVIKSSSYTAISV
jgi:hypothetical protein